MPYRRSPASPRPGTMNPCSLSPRSSAATTICTSGCSSWIRVTPSGAPMMAISRTDVAPAALTRSTAAAVELPRCKHRIKQDHVARADVLRELQEVLDGLQRRLVAIQADVADTGARNQREDGVEHADTCTKNRTHGHFLPRDALDIHLLERCLDTSCLGCEIFRCLVGEKQRQLVDELTEHLRGRSDVAQQTQLVAHERMVNDR